MRDKPGEQPRGWAGVPAQTRGYSTGNGQRAALLRAELISPESSRVEGQACLHRHADIRRATDSEQLCCELNR